MSQRRFRTGEREAGISLVELLVTMMILSFVVITTAALVIGTQRTSQQTVNRLDQIESARFGVERMSHTLRTAVMPSQLLTSCAGCTEDAFVQGRKFEVQFYGNIDNPRNTVGPSRVTYTITSTGTGVGDLVQSIQVPDSPTPTSSGYQYCDPRPAASPSAQCLSRVRSAVVARDVLVDPAVPLFRYFNELGNELNPGNGSLSAGELGRVLSVELYIRVQQQNVGAQAGVTSYIQRVMLPNAQAVIRQGEEED